MSKTTRLKAVINHVFLPSELPGGADDPSCEDKLLSLVAKTLKEFAHIEDEPLSSAASRARRAVDDFRALTGGGEFLQEEKLNSSLKELTTKVGVLPIYIKEQNAALIVENNGSDTISFDSFELSPLNGSIMSTHGRLRRTFPAVSVGLPATVLASTDFRNALSESLAKMSIEKVPSMYPKAMKAGSEADAIRNTPDPSIVTTLLNNFLLAHGRPGSPKAFTKNTRDEVCLNGGERFPWRRSPVWLFIRVLLQRMFQTPDHPNSDTYYKSFMIYFMASILQNGVDSGLSTELLYTMLAKINQRQLKLGPQGDELWLKTVLARIHHATQEIERRWNEIKKAEHGSFVTYKDQSHDCNRAADLRLPGLDNFIQRLQNQSDNLSRASDFQPKYHFLRTQDSEIPQLSPDSLTTSERFHELFAVEVWVDKHLSDWLVTNVMAVDTCQKLYLVTESYHAQARQAYVGSPEALSIMHLTLLSLWVACDKAAVKKYGLLLKYSPQIPTDFWQMLQLRTKRQLERIHVAECYLQSRSGIPIFSKFGDPESFAVQFFNTSQPHQALKSKIEESANQERERKRQELRDLKAKRKSIFRQANELSHDYIENRRGQTVHHWDCARCRLEREGAAMEISVHEWPLPSRIDEAKAAVFELALPSEYSAWRDHTLYFHTDILQYIHSAGEWTGPLFTLQGYRGLIPYYQPPNRSSSISLASEAKPWNVTHMKGVKVGSATECDVLLENGLVWRLYDVKKNSQIIQFRLAKRAYTELIFTLPPASALQQSFLQRFPSQGKDHASVNRIIAEQGLCPQDMSLDEFKDLFSLPQGFEIQWSNILRQLAIPTVNWQRPATCLVLWQAMNQTGPPGSEWFRMSHHNLQDLHFISQVLRYLHKSLSRVKQNWDSSLAVVVFSSIATHILSIGHSDGADECLNFLQSCREVCLAWLQTLRVKAFNARDEKQRNEWTEKQHEIALAVANCFPTDEPKLRDVLRDSDALAEFLECSITAQQTWTKLASRNTIIESLRVRWQRSVHSLPLIIRGSCKKYLQDSEKGVSYLSTSHATGFDVAMSRVWSAFRPAASGQWTRVKKCWVTTRARAADGQPKIQVHINLLSGELLINGLPLGRLPAHFENHSSYSLLFGSNRLDCGPSCELGMEFQAGLGYLGNEVHLAMQDDNKGGKDMLVLTRRDASTSYLIPAYLLSDRLPSTFVDEFVHWYVVDDDSIVLKPKSEPWTSLQTEYILRRNGNRWRLEKGKDSVLINPRSELGTQLASVFAPLETQLGLHIWYAAPDQMIRIGIPRLRQDFFMAEGSDFITSVQYTGMCVSNHILDTLTGLQSKLLLHNQDNPDRQMILIPEGTVSFVEANPETVQRHVHVKIARSATKIQAYHVRQNLGTLEGSGSLQSKLYLAYLHALTSFVLPDGLTGLTGVEQALTILRNGGVRSFETLSADNIGTLEALARLSPSKEYYPIQMKMLQRVSWSSALSFFTQHEDLALEVQRIFNQAQSESYLHPTSSNEYPDLADRLNDLCRRGARRSSTFRTAGFGSEHFSTQFDQSYDGRVKLDSVGGARVRTTCKALLSKEIPILVDQKSESGRFAQRLEIFFAAADTISGSSHQFDLDEIQYGERWLRPPLEVFSEFWCRIHNAFRKHLETMNAARVRLWLCSMCFPNKMEPVIIQALCGLISRHQNLSPEVPKAVDYYPSDGSVFDEFSMHSSLSGFHKDFGNCPEARLPRLPDEDRDDWKDRRNQAYEKARQNWVASLSEQWPCHPSEVKTPDDYHVYFNTAKAVRAVQVLWQRWYDNLQFKQYLQNFGKLLKPMHITEHEVPPNCRPSPPASCQRNKRSIDLRSVFKVIHPPEYKKNDTVISLARFIGQADAQELSNFKRFLGITKEHCRSEIELRYIASLEASALSLYKQAPPQVLRGHPTDLRLAVEDHAKATAEQVERVKPAIDQLLQQAAETDLGPTKSKVKGIQFALTVHQTPRWTTRSLLVQLNHNNVQRVPTQWKAFLVRFAHDIEIAQWSRRLVMSSARSAELLKELTNEGCRSWNRAVHIDTLLLEIEANIRVREVQGEIASLMRDPPSGKDVVMQLNMGEGKSSVIVPIVASSLAGNEGRTFVRVIVAKPQSGQMLEMLLSAVGGIVDRRVYHLPFSRSVQITVCQARRLHEQCEECIKTGGIMLLQPEHILSLQHMTVESAIKGQKDLCEQLLSTWKLIHECGRDLIDESDENFSPKRELVYTLGKQQPIDFAPKRWVVTQRILDMIPSIASAIHQRLPDSMEVQAVARGRFPRIRLLNELGQARFVEELANHLFDVGMVSFPVARQSQQIRQAIKKFITSPNLTKAEIEAVEKCAFWGPTTQETILLIRGLFAQGIMAFAFANKRWRVNYGLHPKRIPATNLAVPYTAKDIPSPRSEFSHPDVQIILTCLSYYYQGLSDKDLFATLQHLQKSDRAAEEYQEWTSTAADFPAAYSHIRGVNLKDVAQCREEVFPHLQSLKATIDYYLSQLVFPKEMRVFPYKLSASGWDLAASKHQPLSGFSGTNDSQHLLPLSVTQLDLDSQRHTNALVLEYLLRGENSVTLMPSHKDAAGSYGEAFLQHVSKMQPETRVILDVGAQIIDLTNEEVAETWLTVIGEQPEIQGVVFCDSSDQLCVLDRQGRIEGLWTSPFKGKLDICLVFLDEAHTRGIDLRLPTNYRAAVTLGAHVTKDRLAQACMRMRQLGKGQTVVFCVPNEIEVKIRDSRPVTLKHETIQVSDVLSWAIGETLADLKRLIPLWSNQGKSFHGHQDIWREIEMKGQKDIDEEDARKFLDDDAPSIETRYRPGRVLASQQPVAATTSDGPLGQIAQRCADFGVQPFETQNLQEEQERELEPEAEQERQIERPAMIDAAPHKLRREVIEFVRNGTVPEESRAFQWAFESLEKTSAATKLSADAFPFGLRVTTEFARSVARDKIDANLDAFQRDVRWVLTAAKSGTVCEMVIISPFEADKLMEEIRKSSAVKLHIYSPRQTQAVDPIDDLQLYVVPSPEPGVARDEIPARLITELNIFAGQLYFGSFDDYVRTCEYLNLSWKATERGAVVQADGFIKPEDRTAKEGETQGFQESPVSFLRVLMAKIRKNCGEIEKTQMGQVLEGGLLTKADFGEDAAPGVAH